MIIHDIAKGLAYLHEDCSQNIVHLDIRPQNILLDQNYNAELSDLGLSKLINKNQSRVITVMRGTPGYLALEWLLAVITEIALALWFLKFFVVGGISCILDQRRKGICRVFSRKRQQKENGWI
ncbi:putative G-type lectin S-receptor-like serine/threonine-protein kinase SD2-5 [Forsythia ovata]|uniref:G-type lectin S-receptor-like serine/threonine-protein kinase SD2-5 n=1 Tax=Forsythia ovata TaxID=205694 RepID=A0ABD1S7R6_9LAMI